MDFNSSRLPYLQTGSFSHLALDYIDQADTVKPFYAHPSSLSGIQRAMEERKKFPTNRKLLVSELRKQYDGIATSEKVKQHIESLISDDTFTITTAHQNNLFTGPLYFIYKIVHAIKLADELSRLITGKKFVPVFYIGSEDADLDELNHIHLGGEKIIWETKQTGAVGRMMIDKAIAKLIDRIEGQLSVLPNGNEYVALLRKYYREGQTVQQATFEFVNELFAEYGLIVLLPDNAALKEQMIPVFEDDLLQQTASGIVESSAEKLEEAGYKVQAHPREINLFYLKDDKRERIINQGDRFKAGGGILDLSSEELKAELRSHPERFSPNVILRGLYQETILPNVAFIGGAGETAYWLQLKSLFEHYRLPFPVLVLRNSFLIVEKKWQERSGKLGFDTGELFLPEQELMNKWVIRESRNNTRLNGAVKELQEMYETWKQQAVAVDTTLGQHVEALKQKAVYRLEELEKKMLRAEKRKFADQQRQIHALKNALFPGGGLQERHENLSFYFGKWGRSFIKQLYTDSPSLEQEFVILTEK